MTRIARMTPANRHRLLEALLRRRQREDVRAYVTQLTAETWGGAA
jgi:hypothetical protein